MIDTMQQQQHAMRSSATKNLGSKGQVRTTDQQVSGQQKDNYPLLWIVLAILSTNVSVPAIRRIIQHEGIAGSGIALAIAIIFGLLFGLAIAVVNRIERRSYRFGLVVLLGAFLALLWYWSN